MLPAQDPNSPGLVRRLTLPLIGVLAVFVYATVGYMVLGFGFIDALFMAALALTTAGFTPVGELNQAHKAFTVSIAVFGVTLFLILLAILTSAITERRIGIRGRRRRMESRIAKLRNHYIVCAYGRVGRSAVREFESEGTPFIVIEGKEELEEEMRRDGVDYIVANPASERVLRRARVEDAKGLVCAMDDDSANVFITVIARSMNPDIFIVARASAPESPEVLHRAGADRVVSPYVSSGGHMGRLALRPGVVDFLEVDSAGQERLRIEEILVDDKSPLAGQTIQEVCRGAVPLVLRRQSGMIIHSPPGETTVTSGDLLLVFGEPEK